VVLKCQCIGSIRYIFKDVGYPTAIPIMGNSDFAFGHCLNTFTVCLARIPPITADGGPPPRKRTRERSAARPMGEQGPMATTNKSLAQSDKSISPTLSYGMTALLHSVAEDANANHGAL
jgi:hypothetical protein